MKTADDYIQRVLRQLPRGTPLRSQIALELRAHIDERVSSGRPLHAVVEQLGDPRTLAESYLAALPLVSAPFLKRAGAKIVDVEVVLLVVAPTLWLAWRTGSSHVLTVTIVLAAIAVSVGFGMYTVLAETWFGQTLGKRLFDLWVVRESGAPVGLGRAVVRSMPMFFQFYWIDVLFALFTDEKQRAFEMLSETRVVAGASPDEQSGTRAGGPGARAQ